MGGVGPKQGYEAHEERDWTSGAKMGKRREGCGGSASPGTIRIALGEDWRSNQACSEEGTGKGDPEGREVVVGGLSSIREGEHGPAGKGVESVGREHWRL